MDSFPTSPCLPSQQSAQKTFVFNVKYSQNQPSIHPGWGNKDSKSCMKAVGSPHALKITPA